MSGQPFDPRNWQVQASGTPEGVASLNRRRAYSVIGEPLVLILGVLFELGLIANDKPFVVPVTTPQRSYRVTISVDIRGADEGQR
jgi:hypothetical protein